LKRLAEEDKSDWTEKTQAFCAAAHPTADVKKAAWDNYFNDQKEWSYHALAQSFSGFKQVLHRGLLEPYNN
jgi:hypothetical protein